MLCRKLAPERGIIPMEFENLLSKINIQYLFVCDNKTD
jgi:hypothetical protein